MPEHDAPERVSDDDLGKREDALREQIRLLERRLARSAIPEDELDYSGILNDAKFKLALVTELKERRASPAPVSGVTIAQLQHAHVVRQDEWCPDQKPDLSFRGNEMAGEVGEACNVIKKLERARHGWRGSRDTLDHLGEELADVVHTAILCAITAGIELDQFVIGKFNLTSKKNGLATLLSLPTPSDQPAPPAPVEVTEAWREFEGDFNALTDSQIAEETQKAEDDLEQAESWLEAVASWEAAGRPRAALQASKPSDQGAGE